MYSIHQSISLLSVTVNLCLDNLIIWQEVGLALRITNAIFLLLYSEWSFNRWRLELGWMSAIVVLDNIDGLGASPSLRLQSAPKHQILK
jgi:hypothetical protein